jgi:4-hydroxybenzoate polyprenyltransferase
MLIRILTKNQRLVFIKLLTLLSLVRWYNILLIVISQYLTSLFILNQAGSWLHLLLDYRLFLIALASAFLIAGGYIINSFYDLEKDLVNKPKKIIFERYISKWFSLNCYFLFSFIGLLLSYFVSFKILIFNAIFLFAMWLYSHKLKKTTLVGNVSATLLSIAPFFSVCIYYGKINALILAYVSYIFIIELTREVIKDMEAIKGDVIFGYNTLPVVLGERKAKYFLHFLMALSLIPPLVLSCKIDNFFIMGYFVISSMLILYAAFRLPKANSFSAYHFINTLYKFIILLGIGSIIFI